MFTRHILATVALVATCAQAQLTITNPSPSSWWVAGAQNLLAWTCDTSPYSAYTVVLSNNDTRILAAPLALIASVPNYDCSFTVNPQQSSQPVSDTYIISLANIENITDVYATASFAIKAAGTPYAATSAASGSASGTATGSAGSASSTSTSKTGAAAANYIPVGMSMAAALLLGLVVA